MRSSSNPAFRNLPTGGGYGGYAGFGQPEQAGYQQQPPPLTSERPMTIDDVVTKTGITLAVVAVTAVVTYLMKAWVLLFPAAIIGLVLALIITFKRNPSPPLVIAYAAVEGIFLGAFSGIIGAMIDRWTGNPGQGVVVIGQAIIGTIGVFAGMLVVYKTGAIRVTPKFTKWITGAIIGVGAMGEALFSGLQRAGWSPDQLSLCVRREDRQPQGLAQRLEVCLRLQFLDRRHAFRRLLGRDRSSTRPAREESAAGRPECPLGGCGAPSGPGPMAGWPTVATKGSEGHGRLGSARSDRTTSAPPG